MFLSTFIIVKFETPPRIPNIKETESSLLLPKHCHFHLSFFILKKNFLKDDPSKWIAHHNEHFSACRNIFFGFNSFALAYLGKLKANLLPFSNLYLSLLVLYYDYHNYKIYFLLLHIYHMMIGCWKIQFLDTFW